MAVIVNDGLERRRDAAGRSLRDEVAESARRYGMRLLGRQPRRAGAAHRPEREPEPRQRTARPAGFPSRSQGDLHRGARLGARQGIGFSHFVALGDCADIDFGDVLDYLGTDPDTSAILLYIDEMRERGNFMAAACRARKSRCSR
ncbi:MAG: hypothetical protein M5U30_18810 [Burkholderiaceae bacterium]|nr:hypothetical protein [Burkholderiaceae bacterium]